MAMEHLLQVDGEDTVRRLEEVMVPQSTGEDMGRRPAATEDEVDGLHRLTKEIWGSMTMGMTGGRRRQEDMVRLHMGPDSNLLARHPLLGMEILPPVVTMPTTHRPSFLGLSLLRRCLESTMVFPLVK